MGLEDPHEEVRHLLQSGHFGFYFLLSELNLGIL